MIARFRPPRISSIRRASSSSRSTNGDRTVLRSCLKFLSGWTGGPSNTRRIVHPAKGPIHIWTDASTRYGAGGHLGAKGTVTDAFAYRFPSRYGEYDISFKELHAAAHAVRLWQSEQWRGRIVILHTDNTEVTHGIETSRDKPDHLQPLFRSLRRTADAGGFTIRPKTVAGKTNALADALSRFQWHRVRGLSRAAAEIIKLDGGDVPPVLRERLPEVWNWLFAYSPDVARTAPAQKQRASTVEFIRLYRSAIATIRDGELVLRARLLVIQRAGWTWLHAFASKRLRSLPKEIQGSPTAKIEAAECGRTAKKPMTRAERKRAKLIISARRLVGAARRGGRAAPEWAKTLKAERDQLKVQKKADLKALKVKQRGRGRVSPAGPAPATATATATA